MDILARQRCLACVFPIHATNDPGRILVYLELFVALVVLIASSYAAFKAVQAHRVHKQFAQIAAVDGAIRLIRQNLKDCTHAKKQFMPFTARIDARLFMLYGEEWREIMQAMAKLIEECQKYQEDFKDVFWRRSATPATCRAFLSEYRELLGKLRREEETIKVFGRAIKRVYDYTKQLQRLADTLRDYAEEVTQFQSDQFGPKVLDMIAQLQQEVANTQGMLAELTHDTEKTTLRKVQAAIARIEGEVSQIPTLISQLAEWEEKKEKVLAYA